MAQIRVLKNEKSNLLNILLCVMISTCTTIIVIYNYIQNNKNLPNGTTHGTSNITIVSRLSTQLEPRSFVRILLVGAYFRHFIPKCVL
jgi:hypothetical protein